MIDARDPVDAMTLATSPFHVMRTHRFIDFPPQPDHHRVMTTRTWDSRVIVECDRKRDASGWGDPGRSRTTRNEIKMKVLM
ncbi:hypothetical protein [Burkholderia metallica]|uniref:hypothetical protein n=1 Tax=Burkholderia metallica TaxID=488729 RepID=UPI001CF54476|nr:hypothetical protein [Burkholderia metallica]MCA7999146.1 hypothetical protein [Burkholderia metallica]